MRQFKLECGLEKPEDDEIHLPAHLLAYHTSLFLNLECSINQKMTNSTKIRPQLTIDPDTFSSTRNTTEYLYIWRCDLSRLNFAFLNRFDQLKLLNIYQSFNVAMADWGSLPPLPALEELYIGDDGTNPNNSWAGNSLPTFEHGIKKISLVGIGFSEDETAKRILHWIHRSSAETLTHVEFKNWNNLTRIPRLLLGFLHLDSLKLNCGNYENNRTMLIGFIASKSFRSTGKSNTIRHGSFNLSSSNIKFLSINDWDLKYLDLTFLLTETVKLQELKIHHLSEVEMTELVCLPLLPPLEDFYIQEDQINIKHFWFDNCPPFKFGISKLSLTGVGFSGDETADRILQWLFQASAETLKHVELISWNNLTRIPRRLSSFQKLDSLEIICDNFKLPIIEESSIVFNVPFRLFSLKNCGVKEIKPGAFQGRKICFYFKSFSLTRVK